MDDKELERKAQDPSTTSPSYEVMAPRWDLIDALLGGTETMRAAGEEYLPRHQEEEDVGYQDRLRSAVLYNMTEHTLESLTGRLFREEPEIVDVPPAVAALLEDVDLQGNALSTFARDWFRTGLAKGFCGALVDFPRKDEKVATKEDEEKAGLRPYWVAVEPGSILDVKTVVANGVEKLAHVRIMETYDETVGFATVQRRRIRVLEPGSVQFFEEQKDDKGKVTWRAGEKFPVDMPEIPLVIWYSTKREAPLLCKPRLLDLAELNKCHWQSTADQRHILTVCRFPILACSGSRGPTSTAGADAEEGIVIGPNKVVYIDDPAGRLYYVEHTGASVAAGERDLQNLERQMASYGSQFLTEKPGDQTATAAAIDSAESTSELAAMGKTFQDAVAQVLYFTAKWMGLDGENTGTISLDYSWSKQGQEQDQKPPRKAPGASDASDAKGGENNQQESQQ